MGGRASHEIAVANGYHEDIYVKIVTIVDGTKFIASSMEEMGSTRIGFTRIQPGRQSPFIIVLQSGKNNYSITIETESKYIVCDSYTVAPNKNIIVDKAGRMKFARPGAVWEDDYDQSHKLPDSPITA